MQFITNWLKLGSSNGCDTSGPPQVRRSFRYSLWLQSSSGEGGIVSCSEFLSAGDVSVF